MNEWLVIAEFGEKFYFPSYDSAFDFCEDERRLGKEAAIYQLVTESKKEISWHPNKNWTKKVEFIEDEDYEAWSKQAYESAES